MTRHLVLADDSTTTQKVIQLCFAEEDFKIHVFANGTSALEHLRNYGGDIVLADISLPHLDGYDLCQEIRQDPRTAGLPVVLLAGTFEPFDAERAMEVGYTSLLIKPFETGKLVDLVKKLVSRPAAVKTPFHAAASVDKAGSEAAETFEKVTVVPQETKPLAIAFPIPSAGGRILFELSPQQCRFETTERPPAPMVAELSSEQLEELVEKLIERLPNVLRSLLPGIAKEVLRKPYRESGALSEHTSF